VRNFSNHEGLKAGLQGPGTAAMDAIAALTGEIMERIVRAPTPTMSLGRLHEATATARTTSAQLWQELLGQQDQMIGIRLEKSLKSRRTVMVGLGVVVLIMLLLAVGMARNFSVLASTVKTLRQSVQMLTQAVGNIEEQTTAHSQAITRQAAALQETQSTAQEIKQTSQVAAESAVGILQVVERADALGKSGEGAIEASLHGLGDIRRQFDEIAVKIRELDERTVQIGGITQTVRDLADQSNMLALNAAIEAVRSGEHGKGFTVVAREIRSLADQSVQATSRVQELLESISSAVRKAVSITDTGGQRIEAGLLQVKGTGESLRELSKMVMESSQGVRQIAAAVSQQNVGISQIFTAVIDQNKMMDDTVKRLELTRDATGVVKTASADLETASRDLNV
jgi:methyl-accepting chemotaxis protein